ncbi:MAG: hypothetical protein H7Y04_02885 [Verrucomicrobia bacterium]|nr:hypothetical protein [Cytophagales bacterium]
MAYYLLYQAYGHADIFNECFYSILSFFRTSTTITTKQVKIVVYTDKPEKFADYPVITEKLAAEKITEWRGEKDFVHRLKIKVLQDFFSKYPQAALIYSDTDTAWLQDGYSLFEEIKNGTLYMHIREETLDSKTTLLGRKIYRFLKKNDFGIPLDTFMWNAGLIGMNEKKQDLLQEVLKLSDKMYAAYQKHVMEQLAFSFIFQKYGRILPAENYVYHYWNFKEFRVVLNDFFMETASCSFEEKVALSVCILPFEMAKAKNDFKKQPYLLQKIRKMIGKSWQMPPYTLSPKLKS